MNNSSVNAALATSPEIIKLLDTYTQSYNSVSQNRQDTGRNSESTFGKIGDTLFDVLKAIPNKGVVLGTIETLASYYRNRGIQNNSKAQADIVNMLMSSLKHQNSPKGIRQAQEVASPAIGGRGNVDVSQKQAGELSKVINNDNSNMLAISNLLINLLQNQQRQSIEQQAAQRNMSGMQYNMMQKPQTIGV